MGVKVGNELIIIFGVGRGGSLERVKDGVVDGKGFGCSGEDRCFGDLKK